MPTGPTGKPKCRHCGEVTCFCCPDCGRNVWEEEHDLGCSSAPAPSPQELKPAPKQNRVPCKACAGTGRSSANHRCVPCDGTGRPGALVELLN